jgi:glycosyltransferase involved in cell wall biosynthesis
MTVGLVHDYLLVMRGAERTFAAMADCWPDAPIYTLLYDEQATGGQFADRRMKPSMLQPTGAGQQRFRSLLPVFPWAVRTLSVQEHDLIVSSSSAFALGVRPRRDAIHVCYCHSPFRYAWHERDRALREVQRPLRPMLQTVMHGVRRADRSAATYVTDFVANSAITRDRIEDFYGRRASIIHPPVDVGRFTPAQPEDYLLIVGEVVAHKRVDVALEAARRARRKVKVVGTGPELERLRTEYAGVAEFLLRVDDRALEDLYARAQALVVANVEEFGIAAVEAQAAGRPVLGVEAGGLRETVVPGVTGVLVPDGSVDALADAMSSVDFGQFDSEVIREHAQSFSTETFKRRIKTHVEHVYARRR